MNKWIHILLLLIFPFSSWSSEELFWEELASLEKKMFLPTREVMTQMSLVDKAFENAKKTSLMQSAQFDYKVDFLALHASAIELKKYLEENLSQVPSTHIYLNQYLSILAVLYFENDEVESYHKTLNKLIQNNADIYVSIAELIVSPNKNNYQKLASYCTSSCNFYLYHKALAEYYSAMGYYSLLEKFAVEMIDENYQINISENYSHIKSRTFLAYIYIAKKCQTPEKEELDDIYNASIDGVEHLKGLSTSVNRILNMECLKG
jgi:hypothetical protein